MVRVFLINQKDSMVILLEAGKKGNELHIVGEKSIKKYYLKEDVQEGHKVAIKDIAKGEQVIKYGTSIGTAQTNIRAGEWVHIHNISSDYDKISNQRAIETGAPLDRRYE